MYSIYFLTLLHSTIKERSITNNIKKCYSIELHVEILITHIELTVFYN